MLQGKKAIGHPVDVASGILYSTHEDISIPGKVALTWQRRYSTALLNNPATPLGLGWTCRYFATLTMDDEVYRLISPEGEAEFFADPEGKVANGDIIRNIGTFQEMTKTGSRYIVTRWDVDTGKVERYVFKQGTKGEAWPLASIEDVTGQGLDLLRDDSGRLTGIQQRLEKRTFLIDYTSGNRISSIFFLMPDNKRQVLARYEYDKSGRLITAYTARGYADQYEYNSESRMIREFVKNGGVFSFKYDDKGRCIRTAGIDGYDEKIFRYIDHIGWTEVTNSYGNVTRFQWLPSGQVVCEIDALGGRKKTEYDEYGRKVTTIAANSAETKYLYDELGNRSKVIDVLGNPTEFVFNQAHLMVRKREPNGAVWKLEYDSRNRLAICMEPLGGISTFTYDNVGNLVQANRPNGAHLRQAFSENGVLQESTDWGGNVTRYRFNEFGLLIEETGPLGDSVHFQYDLAHNLTQVEFSNGSTIRATHDAGDNLLSLTDGNGYTTKYRYGSCNRLLNTTDPLGHTTRYCWGSEPDLLGKVINEKGEAYSLFYDSVGRLISVIGFDGKESTFACDSAGNCIAFTNSQNERITYEYDLVGNIIRENLPDGEAATFQYDRSGNLISAVNSACEVKFERDLLGRVIRESQDQYVIEHEYDVVGHMTKTTTSLGHGIEYDIDDNGRLSRLTTNQRYSIEITRDAEGKETIITFPGKINLEQTYDDARQLTEQRVTARRISDTGSVSNPGHSEGAIIQRRYQYDKTGALTSVLDKFWGKMVYSYDPAQRLIQALRNSEEFERFFYDSTRNLTEIRDSRRRNDLLGYAPGNRLLQRGNTHYSYDDNGRMKKKVEDYAAHNPKEWLFTWDAKDQLRSITRPDGNVWEYTYDAIGRRICKRGANKVIRFVWDSDVILHQIENDALESTWIFEIHNFNPICKLQNGSIYSIITDHLGTPRELIDTQGKIVWRAQYESWGGTTSVESSNGDMPVRFPGQWFDNESGLHYNRFRYYDGQTGRFLSQDPIGILGGFNLYSYVINPINWIDPLGLGTWGSRLPAGMSRAAAQDTTLRSAMQNAGRPGSTINLVPDHLLDSTVADVAKNMKDPDPQVADEADRAMKLLKQDKDEKAKSKDHC
jgi:RHS repeat-associated protein